MPARVRSWFDDNAPVQEGTYTYPDGRTETFTPYEDGGFTGNEIPPLPNGQTSSPSTTTPTTLTAPPGGFTEAWFRQTFGAPATPEQLVALEPQLAKYGIKVRRNASGIAGDIELPGGQIIDVITGAMSGGRGFQWNPDQGVNTPSGFQVGTYTGGGQYPLSSYMGTGLMQPWTTPFTAPNDVTQANDPGWQFRMKEALNAIQRSAAGKGTLLTGGTMKDLMDRAQDYASYEYDKVYNRAFNEYKTAYDIYNNNQGNAYSRLYNLSGQGLQAAGGANNAASGYMNAATNTIEGIGNVQGAGIAGNANIWANLPAQLANIWGPMFQYWYTGKTPVPSGGGTGSSYPPGV